MSGEHPLKKEIERHHIKNSEIAETLHISPGRVSQILNGDTRGRGTSVHNVHSFRLSILVITPVNPSNIISQVFPNPNKPELRI